MRGVAVLIDLAVDTYMHTHTHTNQAMVQHAPKGGSWVDMGGGTGANLEFLGQGLRYFDKVREWWSCMCL